MTTAISRDPASHGRFFRLVPAAGYDVPPGASQRPAGRLIPSFSPDRSAGIAIAEIQRAKTICASCPVRQPRLEFALAARQEFGIGGGYDETERRLLHRQRRESTTATGQ